MIACVRVKKSSPETEREDTMKILSVNGAAILALALLTMTPAASTAEDQLAFAKPTKKTSPSQPLKVTVELASETNSHLKGTLLEIKELSVDTAFGTASIPLHAVAGMRLPQKDSPMTTIILSNGDSVTGTTQLDQLFVQTEWGKAEVSATSVVSIIFVEGLSWTQEAGLKGYRWNLSEPQPQVYYQY